VWGWGFVVLCFGFGVVWCFWGVFCFGLFGFGGWGGLVFCLFVVGGLVGCCVFCCFGCGFCGCGWGCCFCFFGLCGFGFGLIGEFSIDIVSLLGSDG
ncbi:hypothetical protein DVA80_20770, partial [Acinetobacter baumannii]|uniref:hypothetical protein n=1 Tax=Acinetobacter baumannii TaxID=470 RepID=UPI000E02FA14